MMAHIRKSIEKTSSREYTSKIVDFLSSRGIKASFFMIGQNVANHPSVAKKVSDAGFPIYIHTYTHPDLSSLSREAIQSEIILTRDAIKDATGKPIYMCIIKECFPLKLCALRKVYTMPIL
jgi:peptidoglycan/xylan/chitin deacetylase (PgdA/CDA1 family)